MKTGGMALIAGSCGMFRHFLGRRMGAFSFKKHNRILKRRDFVRLSKKGRRAHSTCFLALYQPARGPCSRLGITVTRKVGNACVRNHVKRCVREYFRTRSCGSTQALDINIIAKKGAAALDCKSVFRELDALFVRMD